MNVTPEWTVPVKWVGMLGAIVAFLALATGDASASQSCSSSKLGDMLVKNAEDAAKIAFAEWHAANSQFQPNDAEPWRRYFTVTLRGCVWEVAEKPPRGHKYSTFVLKVEAADGRFLGAEISD